MNGNVGVVVIGRNEGDRLRRCLLSLIDMPWRVYVDSGSTDGSCELARQLGFDVVALDSPPRFTAARARNRGIDRLRELNPSIEFAQTVDGDCRVQPDWIHSALEDMEARSDVAIVIGRLHERHASVNVFHRACARQWAAGQGYVSACGGNALVRLSAFHEVGGFNSDVMAGEEPELCLRLRRRGWAIWSNDREMAQHEADIGSFSQWWRRACRGGYGCAQLVTIHGRNSDALWLRAALSSVVWPLVILMTAVLGVAGGVTGNRLFSAGFAGLGLLLLIQTLRLARARGGSFNLESLCDAGLVLISKIATLQGILQLLCDRATGARSELIEYKRCPSEIVPQSVMGN